MTLLLKAGTPCFDLREFSMRNMASLGFLAALAASTAHGEISQAVRQCKAGPKCQI